MEAVPPGTGPSDGTPPLVRAETADGDGDNNNNNNTIANDNDDVSDSNDPLADNTRTCFICLQTPDEDPTAAWVAPCPCTLTAHQECLLMWIDGKEHTNGDVFEAVADEEVVDEEEVEEEEEEEGGDDNNEADMRRPGDPPAPARQADDRRQRRQRRQQQQQQPRQQRQARQPRQRRQRQVPPGLRPTRKVRCPACNAPIYTLEAPPDFWVHLGDTIANNYRYYLAPHILATMAATMAIAGSSYYGFSMFMSVAGPDRVIPWLAGGRLLLPSNQRPYDNIFQPASARLLSHPADVLRTNARMALLGLVAPSLLLHRAMPFFTYSIGLPLSWIWSVSLAVQRYRATRSLAVPWPPSASVCMAALPSISMAYAMVYYSIFGRFERRLDQALGHALESYVEQNNNNNNNNNNDAAPRADQAAADAARDHEDGRGLFGLVRRLGGAAADVVRGNNAGHDGGGGNGDGGNGGGGGGGGLFGVFNDNEHIEFQIEVVVEERADNDEPPAAAVPVPVPAPAPAPVPAPAPANNDNQIQLLPERLSMRRIIAASTTQLLLPSIASTIGDLLWLVLPASLTKSTRWPASAAGSGPSRFLSQRWARSLVGGALFVVLRDLFKLYGKYRRVQTRGQRMVKNYDRKAHRDRRRADAAR